MQIEYTNVVFPAGTVINGHWTRAMSAKDGRKLTRIVEAGRDDLVITMPGKPEFHIAWNRTGGGAIAAPAPKGVKKAATPVRKDDDA